MKPLYLILFLTIFIACGGGGGGSSADTSSSDTTYSLNDGVYALAVTGTTYGDVIHKVEISGNSFHYSIIGGDGQTLRYTEKGTFYTENNFIYMNLDWSISSSCMPNADKIYSFSILDNGDLVIGSTKSITLALETEQSRLDLLEQIWETLGGTSSCFDSAILIK